MAYAPVARAVVDGGRRLASLRDVRALLLGAVCSRRLSADALTAEIEAGAQRGSGLVRRAADDARAGAWSAPEAEAAALVAAAVRARRLPPYLLDPLLHVGGVRVGRPDGWFAGTRVGWQVDSRRHHADGASFDRTLATHDAYAAHGLTLLHVTPRRLRLLQEHWVREHWVQLLIDAVRASAPGSPPGLGAVPVGPLQTGRRPRPALAGTA